jgi:hypothetical protein
MNNKLSRPIYMDTYYLGSSWLFYILSKISDQKKKP